MPRTRPPYPPEFRAAAVRLVRTGGKLIGEVANDLGVSEQTLRTGSAKVTWTTAAATTG